MGHVIALSLGAVLVCTVVSDLNMQLSTVFVGGSVANHGQRAFRLEQRAEPTPAAAPTPAAPAPAPDSVALVKINPENKAATASILGGLAGTLLGGVWVGGALFAAASYLSRKEGDVSSAVNEVASSALQTLNFGASLNDQYTVTDQIGSALSGAINNVKENAGGGAEAINTLTGVVDGAVKIVDDLDKDVNIKATLGNVLSSASELAAEAVDTVVDRAKEVNEEFKITDQITDKAKEAADKVQQQLK